jgi:hypothetical protein
MELIVAISLFTAIGVAGFCLANSRLKLSRQLIIIVAFSLSWVAVWIFWDRVAYHSFSFGGPFLDNLWMLSLMGTLLMLPGLVAGWFLGWIVRGIRRTGSPQK